LELGEYSEGELRAKCAPLQVRTPDESLEVILAERQKRAMANADSWTFLYEEPNLLRRFQRLHKAFLGHMNDRFNQKEESVGF